MEKEMSKEEFVKRYCENMLIVGILQKYDYLEDIYNYKVDYEDADLDIENEYLEKIINAKTMEEKDKIFIEYVKFLEDSGFEISIKMSMEFGRRFH